MDIQEYNADEHYQTLLSWLLKHNAYLPTPEEMPKIGYVAVGSKGPVAMAFLRRVEGNYAQLDGLTSNPEAPGKQRHQAIDIVVESVFKRAKRLGIKSILALSVDKNTLVRSEKHGFAKQPHSVIVANLVEKA